MSLRCACDTFPVMGLAGYVEDGRTTHTAACCYPGPVSLAPARGTLEPEASTWRRDAHPMEVCECGDSLVEHRQDQVRKACSRCACRAFALWAYVWREHRTVTERVGVQTPNTRVPSPEHP